MDSTTQNGSRISSDAATATDIIEGRPEIAKFLRVREQSLPALIAQGLPVARYGQHYVATRRQLVQWVEEAAAKQMGVQRG